MKTTKLILLLAVLAFSFSGCLLSRVTAPGTAGTKGSNTGFSLFWGITGTEHGATDCQYGLKEVTNYIPWYSMFLQGITLGIVSPVTREYTCLAQPTLSVPVSVVAPAAK